MTDRNLTADMAEHARREAGQPEPGLRDRMAEAIRAEWSQLPDDRGPHQHLADVVLSVVQHDLESLEQQAGNAVATAYRNAERATRAEAERDRLTAELREVREALIRDWDARAVLDLMDRHDRDAMGATDQT